MKYVMSILMLMSASFATATGLPAKDVVIGIHDVYVPGGFGPDSDAYVVVNGVFPNSCYRFGRAEVVDKDKATHEITSIARVQQGMCLQMLVPYTKEVRLGQLSSGTHTLRFMNGDGTYFERTMEIE